MQSKILKVLKLLFTPVAIAFLFYFIWLSRHDLAATFGTAAFEFVAFAVAAWCLFNMVTPLIAVVLFANLGLRVSWRQALAIHASRLPARYVPGGVWHTVGRVLDYRGLGVQARHLTAFVILENGLAAALALAIGGAAVFATREPDQLATIAAVSSIAGIVALPVIFIVINRRVFAGADHFKGRSYLTSVVLMTGIWLLATTAFLSYLGAFSSSIGSPDPVEMGGIYLFSWGVGFLSIFAPQGIGVFEIISSKLADSPLGFAGLAALISGFRLIVLVADLLVWAGYHFLRRWADGDANNDHL